MQVLNTKLFQAKEYTLVIYNGKAIINYAFRFFTVVDCVDLPYEEIDFDFPDYTSAYMRVYNERNGRLEKEYTLSQSGTYLVLNTSISEATFEDNGIYYYEIGYVRGVYEQALRYGNLSVV
jgi:hypothetical protein